MELLPISLKLFPDIFVIQTVCLEIFQRLHGWHISDFYVITVHCLKKIFGTKVEGGAGKLVPAFIVSCRDTMILPPKEIYSHQAPENNLIQCFETGSRINCHDVQKLIF